MYSDEPIPLSEVDLMVGDDIGHICVLGQTTSGKTTIIRNLINKLYKEHPGEFCATYWYGFNHTKEHHWLPKKRGQSLINPYKINQTREMMRCPQGLATAGKRVLIIFDDILEDKDMNGKMRSFYKSLIGQSRHEKVTIIVSVQDIMALGPSWRSNIKKWFITGLVGEGCTKLHAATSNISKADLKAAVDDIQLGTPVYLDLISKTKEYIQAVEIPLMDDPFEDFE
jgi:hypothetical protein